MMTYPHMMRNLILLFAASSSMLLFSSCTEDPASEDGKVEVESFLAESLPADPTDVVDGEGRPVGTTGRYTLYSLKENAIVPNADSASTKWDLGFRATEIILNGGVSGPGNAAAQIVEGIFEEIAEAPADGWRQDQASGLAVPTGSGNGWYNYNPTEFLVTPIPGRVMMVRTATGQYAKLKILSYYKDAPDTVDPFTDSERYYTFEYVYQSDGSRRLQ